ncbi:MAG: UDP-N-acetylmuramate--L-alanine ligase [Alphaproteobacteria bacterium]|jgi:UDP-N-acetylmuramate--alanine ligase|nr:UDP-N-acetylmuramate--L-alanine ligase [Alphaproteobacteria bacterium]
MNRIPLDIGPIHFVGIGGIGMSGIAEVLRNLNYKVQGSDVAAGPSVERLRELGVTVHIGHAAANIGEAAVVVVSSAIKDGNPEVDAARARRVPVVRRAEMLAELMRLKSAIAIGGTHGKTTTTSLVAAVLAEAGMDPTVINGGIINALGANAYLGGGEWMVVEADESDGAFLKLPSTVAVVTNVDPEHLDHWGSFDAVRQAFRTFIENIPFYGFAVVCADHPEAQALTAAVRDRRIITYGFNPQADVRAENVELRAEGAKFDVIARLPGSREDIHIEGLELPMFGRHNVQNALVAIAISLELGVADAQVRRGLAAFGGVKRRFTKTGEVAGVAIIDDYGHHPVEISAVLAAARSVATGRVVAVAQPHRYSRLRDHLDEFCTCFNDADHVIIAPVYAAGEAPIDGIDHETLAEGLIAHGHKSVQTIDGPEALAAAIAPDMAPGDFVICLGAGTITRWAATLPGELEALIDGGGAG